MMENKSIKQAGFMTFVSRIQPATALRAAWTDAGPIFSPYQPIPSCLNRIFS